MTVQQVLFDPDVTVHRDGPLARVEVVFFVPDTSDPESQARYIAAGLAKGAAAVLADWRAGERGES